MKFFKMMAVLGWLGLSACGAPVSEPPAGPGEELPTEPLESEQGQDQVLAPSMAFAPGGQLALAWAGPNDLFVRRWTGARWESLGNGLSAFAGETRAFWSAVRMDGQGNPVVAWEEQTPGDLLRNSIVVRRWSDGRWVELGSPLNISGDSYDAYKPSLRLDSEGNPIVAWSEQDGGDAKIAVRRWGPTGWQALGPTTIASGTAWGLELVGNAPVLVSQRWMEDGMHVLLEVRRWTGTTWESLGKPLGERAIAPQVRADAMGNLYLAWLEEGTYPAPSRIQVARWSGTAWEALGADVAVADGQTYLGVPALELDAEGRPLVAWIHSQAKQALRVARWTGQDWSVKVVEESTAPGSSGGWITMSVHPDQGVVVAWTPHESMKLRVLRVVP